MKTFNICPSLLSLFKRVDRMSGEQLLEVLELGIDDDETVFTCVLAEVGLRLNSGKTRNTNRKEQKCHTLSSLKNS